MSQVFSDTSSEKRFSPGGSWSLVEGLDLCSRAFAAPPLPLPLPPPDPSLTGAGSHKDPGEMMEIQTEFKDM